MTTLATVQSVLEATVMEYPMHCLVALALLWYFGRRLVWGVQDSMARGLLKRPLNEETAMDQMLRAREKQQRLAEEAAEADREAQRKRLEKEMAERAQHDPRVEPDDENALKPLPKLKGGRREEHGTTPSYRDDGCGSGGGGFRGVRRPGPKRG